MNTNRNLVIMWIANFFVAASATMVLPFLSLYIETFGDYSEAYVQRWSGLIFGVTFLAAFFVSPIWGRFGDKYGRKPILIITGFGIAFSILMMSFVSSVTELFFLRLFMGVVTGFIPTSIALISAQTKKEIAGKVLGTLQMGTVSGGLFGPLIGGLLADNVGFAYTFVITGIIISASTLLVWFGIRENRTEMQREQAAQNRRSMWQVITMIIRNRILLATMLVSMMVQVANFSIQPQLALFTAELVATEDVALLTGIAFSVTGLGNFLATRFWGVQGDKFGHDKILVITMLLAGIFFIPQGFVGSISLLIVFRFLFGLAIGGIIPCVTAYIRNAVPLNMQGEVLGYNQSFRFLGNVVGPVSGGLIAGSFGITSVFVMSGLLFFITAGIFVFILINHRKTDMK
ncbi:MFS transporter [Salisediminibacterium selenitireducens]|uniref:Major facilitator superfamily MFS_1 n=1 Tax=Bacillus selenitireducens (strain ATCC 700615 / DSM 15326 / MLS10) TaxID=439292 RepID=D6XUS9_BACIE|nr:MFS transporter [Salisediminibacterium selenitireducens]ADH99565.1 major facilitator superfamily MFS_1 [[Bacillus] selenitireducens MLS10]